MKVLLFALCLGVVLLGGMLRPVGARALSPYPPGSTGNDVSWPNCRAQPSANAAFGIVGVTGGLVFVPNQCLFEESHWFDNLSLYTNTGYPGKARAEKYADAPRQCARNDESCLAYDFGYNAGVYAVFYAASQFVHATAWWLDVETENSWSANPELNRASLQGMVDAINHETFFPAIGFYSYPGQWQQITGGWHNGYRVWVATGGEDRKDAVAACRTPAYNGGKVVLTQYTTRLDDDYACSR